MSKSPNEKRFKKSSKPPFFRVPNLHFPGCSIHTCHESDILVKTYSRLYLGENPNGGFIVSGGWSWIRRFFFSDPLKVCGDLSTISMIRNVFFNEEMSPFQWQFSQFVELFLIRSDGWKSRREKTPHVAKRIYDRCDFLFRLCLRSVSAHLCGPVTCPSLINLLSKIGAVSFPERRYKTGRYETKKLRKSHPRIHFIWSQGFSHDDKCMVES